MTERDRAQLPRVTVSAVTRRYGRFLLVEEEVRGNIVINNPAGHLENDETLVQAVVREVLEETGCTFEPQGVTGIYLWTTPKGDRTFLRVNFFGACLAEDDNAVLDDGILRKLWLTRAELDGMHVRLRSPMVIGCIDDYLNGKQYPLDAIKDMGRGFEE